MHLTKYHVVPADGGWRVVSTLGRTRFDGRVFSWTEACRLKEKLVARQAGIYSDVHAAPRAATPGLINQDWQAQRPDGRCSPSASGQPL
jgi:hypothetical protein